MKPIRALLVGINQYREVTPLNGCLNDVSVLADWLRRTYGEHLALQVLTDEQATRRNVIDGFRRHLGAAEPGETVLFYYSGHGAQALSAAEFAPFFPDTLDEGLVLYDSRAPGGYDLADKELAVLVAELAECDVQVVVGLDACHSGSGTRDADCFDGQVPRLAEVRDDTRPLESYLDGHYARLKARGERLVPPAAPHLLLAACDRTQIARESRKTKRGIFSHALTDVLAQTGGQISYAELFVRCRAAVRGRVRKQDPRFDVLGGFDAWSGFLGADVARANRRYRVFFDVTREEWRVDAGAVHGLGDDAGNDVTLAIFDSADPSHRLATATTLNVGAEESTLQFEPDAKGNPFNPEPGAQFLAQVTSLPASPLVLHGPPAVEAARWQSVLDGVGQPLGACGLLLSHEATGSSYRLEVQDGHLQLSQDGVVPPLRRVAWDPALPEAAVQAMAPTLHAIAQWERLLALKNRRSALTAKSVELSCVELGDGSELEHRVDHFTVESYRLDEDEGWSAIELDFRVRNTCGKTLYPLLLHFSRQFGIRAFQGDPLPSADRWVSLTLDDPIAVSVGLNRQTGEPMEVTDRFKVLLSLRRIEGALLEQPDLAELEASAGRDLVDSKRRLRSSDWTAREVTVRVVPRVDAVNAQRACTLGGGAVRILPHPQLRAQAYLGSATPSGRDAQFGVPFLEAFEQAGWHGAQLESGRGVDGPSVLELSGIENSQSLAQEPLHIELDAALGTDETLISLAYDGQHLLPCGQVESLPQGGVRISIDAIPPTSSDGRSLGSALKLYFFKTYLRRSVVNALRWVEHLPDGSCIQHSDGVAAQVAKAKRIVLMVHGIIGDTEDMALHASDFGMRDHFDLLLTYDYENLNTPIEDTARVLRDQLASVGLSSGHDKQFTVLAHSMGGLVSRWFIEREGGHAVVQHLVMCGTPNRGSPWTLVDDIARFFNGLKAMAANHSPSLLAKVVLSAISFTRVTRTLAQMSPDSTFIANLNASPDPHVRYTVLAGDVHRFKEPSDAFSDQLLAKIGQSYALGLLFWAAPHDIAVAVDSINGIGLPSAGSRQQPPEVHPVACHHLNYFISEPGQAALRALAW